MNTDEFGARMKLYEFAETLRRLDPMLPIYARLDGRSFSTFTRGMTRPCDTRMTVAMRETAAYLVHETAARIGYHQSDEISLVWEASSPESDIFFSGKVMKMASVLASMAAAKFARLCPVGFEQRLPHFDCRVIQMPSREEAANMFLWRAMDARKNAISAAAQAHFSPGELHGKGQAEMLAMLAARGVDFEALPLAFRRGEFIRRTVETRPLTPDEVERIPPRFRPAPGGLCQRSSFRVVEMPPFNEVTNRADVIFNGAEPERRAA